MRGSLRKGAKYVVVDIECVIRPCDAGDVLREKSLGDRAKGVPGGEHIVKLLGDGECSEVPRLNSVEPCSVRQVIKNNNNIQDRTGGG